jgi:hypothetical protein
MLASAFGTPVELRYPVASVVPYDHESPGDTFDEPVRAEMISAMARGRQMISMRHLTEDVVWHFNLYGQKSRGQLIKKVTAAAIRAAKAQPDAIRFEQQTGTTEARLVVVRSPETFDRRGRTQSYQAQFGTRSPRRSRPEIEGQTGLPDLLAELDQAEQLASNDQPGENHSAWDGAEEHHDERKDSPPEPPGAPPVTPSLTPAAHPGIQPAIADGKETS